MTEEKKTGIERIAAERKRQIEKESRSGVQDNPELLRGL